MSFIEGKVFNSYDEMQKESNNAINACKKTLEMLHSFKIFHGDVQAQNFILKTNGDVSIIDLGRSKSNATENELKNEAKQLDFPSKIKNNFLL
jgi:tRNA A-37 threonylcarbamoyl transferase component Bud32